MASTTTSVTMNVTISAEITSGSTARETKFVLKAIDVSDGARLTEATVFGGTMLAGEGDNLLVPVTMSAMMEIPAGKGSSSKGQDNNKSSMTRLDVPARKLSRQPQVTNELSRSTSVRLEVPARKLSSQGQVTNEINRSPSVRLDVPGRKLSSQGQDNKKIRRSTPVRLAIPVRKKSSGQGQDNRISTTAPAMLDIPAGKGSNQGQDNDEINRAKSVRLEIPAGKESSQFQDNNELNRTRSARMEMGAGKGSGQGQDNSESSRTWSAKVEIATWGGSGQGHDNNEGSKTSVDDFDFIKTLGTGSFGRVLLARHKVKQTFHAIKVLVKERMIKLAHVEHMLNEKKILSSISFPFIVSMEATFKDNSNLYMVLEYVPGGELLSHIKRFGKFTEAQSGFYTAQIVMAFEYLHGLDLVYRDLKPENVLLDAQGYLRIVDFGFIKRVRGRTWTLCGTPEFLAPEIVLSKGYNKAVDWWALGVLVYEMVSGCSPFRASNSIKVYEKIIKGNVHYLECFTPELKSFLRNVLQVNPDKRLGNLAQGAKDIKNHKWFSGTEWEAILGKKKRAPIVPKVNGPGDSNHFPEYPEDWGILNTAARPMFQKDFEEF